MCWVRPGVLEAKARPFWLVRILIAVDLPAFERPAKAISGTCVSGKSRSWLTVVKNRACHNLDIGERDKRLRNGVGETKLLYNKGLIAAPPTGGQSRRCTELSILTLYKVLVMNRLTSPLLKTLLVTSLTVFGGLPAAMAASAATAPAVKADPAKGGALYDNGDPARGLPSCLSCHGAAG